MEEKKKIYNDINNRPHENGKNQSMDNIEIGIKVDNLLKK